MVRARVVRVVGIRVGLEVRVLVRAREVRVAFIAMMSTALTPTTPTLALALARTFMVMMSRGLMSLSMQVCSAATARRTSATWGTDGVRAGACQIWELGWRPGGVSVG